MESVEWPLAAVYEVIADAVPGRDVLVWGDTRRTYAQVATRTRNLAAFLHRHGIGSRRERSELERWECGQATVGLILYNCPEYIESMLGCFRARAVPFNVNQHYRPEEVRRLLAMVAATALAADAAAVAIVGRDEARAGGAAKALRADHGAHVVGLAGDVDGGTDF